MQAAEMATQDGPEKNFRISRPIPPGLVPGEGGLGTSRRSRQTLFPRHKAGGAMRKLFFG